MHLTTPLLISAFAFGVHARQCQNLTIPVTLSARNGAFNLNEPASNIDVTDFVLKSSRLGFNYTEKSLTGYNTINHGVNIRVTYCTPDQGAGETIQFLTHGIGFTRAYWDLPFNNYNYSYVNNALAAGYSTFAIDRYGIGESSTGDPIAEVQAPAEISAIDRLTKMIRANQIPGVASFNKVVHVGHSFGSVQSFGLSVLDPTISDGLILTGFSLNSSFLPEFSAGNAAEIARLNDPARFGVAGSTNPAMNLSTGYIIAGTERAVQYNFFSPAMFDPAILTYATANKNPVTFGELLTIASGPTMSPMFKGPVLVITGEYDIPFCGGNCLSTGGALPDIPSDVKVAVPAAKAFKSYIVPGTGHGLNLHYNATANYQVIQDFLKSQGL